MGITLLETAHGEHPCHDSIIYYTSFHDHFNTTRRWITKLDVEDLTNRILYNYSYSNEIRLFTQACLSPLKDRANLEALRNTLFYKSVKKRIPEFVARFLVEHVILNKNCEILIFRCLKNKIYKLKLKREIMSSVSP